MAVTGRDLERRWDGLIANPSDSHTAAFGVPDSREERVAEARILRKSWSNRANREDQTCPGRVHGRSAPDTHCTIVGQARCLSKQVSRLGGRRCRSPADDPDVDPVGDDASRPDGPDLRLGPALVGVGAQDDAHPARAGAVDGVGGQGGEGPRGNRRDASGSARPVPCPLRTTPPPRTGPARPRIPPPRYGPGRSARGSSRRGGAGRAAPGRRSGSGIPRSPVARRGRFEPDGPGHPLLSRRVGEAQQRLGLEDRVELERERDVREGDFPRRSQSDGPHAGMKLDPVRAVRGEIAGIDRELGAARSGRPRGERLQSRALRPEDAVRPFQVRGRDPRPVVAEEREPVGDRDRDGTPEARGDSGAGRARSRSSRGGPPPAPPRR